MKRTFPARSRAAISAGFDALRRLDGEMGFEPPAQLKRRRGSGLKAVKLQSEFVTIDETAEFWRCSRRKVERKLAAKVIPKFKDGHRTLLRIRDVKAHARRMRQK